MKDLIKLFAELFQKTLSNSTYKRWIDIHGDLVADYNISWHRAINTSPMRAFRNRSGFNSSIIQLVETSLNEESKESEEEAVIEDTIVLSNINSSLCISEDSNSIDSLTNVYMEESNIVDQDYRQKYISKIIRDKDVHYHKINFNPDDPVIISKSFDTNSTTRKRKMDGFFEDDTYKIVERIGSHSFKIQDINNSLEIKVFSKNRLRKVNSLS